MEEKPASYFRKLSDMLGKTEVAEREGLSLSVEEGINRSVAMILGDDRPADKHRIMVIGNGGSAVIASHVQNDLCKAVGVRAIVFNEAPLLTALSNDHSYEEAFERMIELWAEKGDLLIAISSSGRSDNILRAVRHSMKKAVSRLHFPVLTRTIPFGGSVTSIFMCRPARTASSKFPTWR